MTLSATSRSRIMKAAVQRGYGSPDLLEIANVERPVPEHDEVLVRVLAAAITLSETMTRTGKPAFVRLFSGLARPKQPVLGSEFAGTITAVGSDVTRFAVGDEVFGSTGSAYGCFAEYVCMPEDGFLATKPTRMTYPEAAPVCGGLAAWNFLRDKADLRSGQRVLVNGASGSIGTMAVQLAKCFGAEVTAVTSAGNIDLVRSLGADEVIDGTAEDFTSRRDTYDVIFDAESESSFARCKGSLTPDGMYLRTFPDPMILLQMMWTWKVGRKRALVSATGLMPVEKRLAFLRELKKLIDAGEIRSVVDRSYPLDDLANAYRYAERGDQSGSVVVTLDRPDGDPCRTAP
jgi:NADPH:quinone reductase-like Zn-dependent oxidoreductase